MHLDDSNINDDDHQVSLPQPRDLHLHPLCLFLEGVIRIGTTLSGISFRLREPLRHHHKATAVTVLRSIGGRLAYLLACRNRNRCNEWDMPALVSVA